MNFFFSCTVAITWLNVNLDSISWKYSGVPEKMLTSNLQWTSNKYDKYSLRQAYLASENGKESRNTSKKSDDRSSPIASGSSAYPTWSTASLDTIHQSIYIFQAILSPSLISQGQGKRMQEQCKYYFQWSTNASREKCFTALSHHVHKPTLMAYMSYPNNYHMPSTTGSQGPAESKMTHETRTRRGTPGENMRKHAGSSSVSCGWI